MSACGALGETFRTAPLPLPVGDLSTLSDQNKDNNQEWEETLKRVLTCSKDELTQLDLVMCLSKLLKSAKEIKACMHVTNTWHVKFCMCGVHLYTGPYTEFFKKGGGGGEGVQFIMILTTIPPVV